MSTRDLDAARISDPHLRESYEQCRVLNAAHGKTYYLATLLLPPAKRPYVHALYGFARYADEIVDDLSSTLTEQEKADWLGAWGQAFLDDVDRGWSDDPICRAVVDTVLRWEIPKAHFEAFLHSMTMDLTVTEYRTYDDLYEYVYGSAAVIGLQMVPILEPTSPEAYDRATDLGVAFQLANFVRDVGEDLYRGRVYLPLDELEQFGVTRAHARAARRHSGAEGGARVPDRPRAHAGGAVAARRRDAAPELARLHRGRPRPVLRHRRRGRAPGLRGVHPPRVGAHAAPARRGRAGLGAGRAQSASLRRRQRGL